MADKARSYAQKLSRYYLLYTAGFILFLVALAILEKEGFPRAWIGYLFIFSTIVLYAGIGVISRTSDVSEYYVAGRRVPAVFNARMHGEALRLSTQVPVSVALQIAALKFSCTGLSAQLTKRVPIWMPSAPRANAAAMPRPSQMPPAAIRGTSTRARMACSSTRVDTSSGFLKPPPSAPSTTRPSTPASTHLSAVSTVGTAW